MADTYEKDLAQKSSLTVSDFIRVVGSDNVSYKQSLLDVGAKGQIGQMGLLSDLNIDDFATNKTYGTWWLNCGDSTITGTKPASSGQGLLICKQQSTSIYRQVYVGISASEFKVRYYNNGSWTSWSNTVIRAEVDALSSMSLSFRGVLTSSDDCDTLTQGVYLFNTSIPQNAPSDVVYGTLIVIQGQTTGGGTVYNFQLLSTSGRGLYYRRQQGNQGSGFAAWTKVTGTQV